MILNDRQIIETMNYRISPFNLKQVNKGVISYGVTSFGYDIRLGPKFKVFTSKYPSNIIDPKSDSWHKCLEEEWRNDYCIIPPNSFVLAESAEHIRMPSDVIAVCVGKSTYARCGLILNVTPLEPDWEGIITLEISNTTPLPAKVYVGEGIGQLMFFRGERPNVTYADRKGKYMNQTGLTLPIVEKE